MPGSRSTAGRRRRPLAAITAGAAIALLATLVLPVGSAAAAAGDGRLYAQGAADDHGSPGETPAPVTGLAATPSGAGYVAATTDGQVHAFGDATHVGSVDAGQPVVDIAAHDAGYWLTTANGGVHARGGARFLGSLGDIALAKPIVGMTATPSGEGYWLVASDGGVFSFGDARFQGSTGDRHLNSPIVGMAAAPDGQGYWLVASDGGIFTFGSATFFGSLGGTDQGSPVVAMASAPSGAGYWLATAAGGVHTFGAAADHGSPSEVGAPVADLAARPAGDGYWLVTGARPRVKTQSSGGAVTYGSARPGDPPDSDFDRLAQCESGQRWHINTGNGYYGGLQFAAATWRSHGGTGLPHEHPREVQIEIGRRQWRQSGWQAWPHCSRAVGLR